MSDMVISCKRENALRQRERYVKIPLPPPGGPHVHRTDLRKRLMMFTDYGKDALLLAVLSYNIGTGRLLGYGRHPKSRLLRKIESGDRNFYREFVSFCRYKGKVLRGLVKRRKVEFALFYVP